MKNMSVLAFIAVVMLIAVSQASAEESSALEAAKAAVAEPVAVPAATAPAAQAETPAPVASTPTVASPPTVEPAILKQLRDHTPIPIRSSLDQAMDTNGNRTLEYDEIKEYIKGVRSNISKNGKYPTNTDVLYHFDKNHDGYMDSGEVSSLESYIH